MHTVEPFIERNKDLYEKAMDKRIAEETVGEKFDDGKPCWDLLPFKQVGQIVEILTFGAKKYSKDNWKSVEPFRDRYFAAMMRHITAWWNGEKKDPESGKSHLAHAGCCLLFLMWKDDMDEEFDKVKKNIPKHLLEEVREEDCPF